MAMLPPAGTSPQEFMEGWLPKAFAEAELPEAARAVEVTLGVRLLGEGGGEWLFHLRGGALAVEAGAVDEAPFCVIQSVADWRGSLWEGRGGLFGRQAALLFQPGAAARAGGGSAMASTAALTPAVVAELQGLSGVLRMEVAGNPEATWRIDFKLGSGPAPTEPTTTVRVSAEDAAAMERGELDPLQAFMTGRLEVSGDLGFLMQMQAIQMTAAARAAGGGGA